MESERQSDIPDSEMEDSFIWQEAVGGEQDSKWFSQHFEQEFSTVQDLETPDGKASFRDIKPEVSDGEPPIVTLLGFGVPSEYDKEVFGEFHNQNAHTIPVDILEGPKDWKSLPRSELKRHARLVGQVIDNLSYEKVRILAVSMDAVTMDELLKERPDLLPKIDSVVLAEPVGMGGVDNPAGFIKRQRKETARWDGKQTVIDRIAGKKFADFFNHQMRHETIKSLKEIFTMGFANRYSLLNTLRENDIPVGLIFGEEDELLSNERIMRRVGKGYGSAFMKDKSTPSGYRYIPASKLTDETAPPIQVIRKTGGGHENMGRPVYADKILSLFQSIKQKGGYSIEEVQLEEVREELTEIQSQTSDEQ